MGSTFTLDNDKVIEFVDDLDKEIETFTMAPAWSGNMLFRGQANSEWTLRSSLARELSGLAEHVDSASIEARATQHFVARARNHAVQLPETDDDWLEWWPIMQHYGVPTRLLDWTRSIHVAIYFAVRDFRNDSRDAAVYCVPFEEVNRATVESGYDMYDRRFVFGLSEDAGLPRIRFLTPSRLTDRMAAQQGMYSVCDSVTLDHDRAIDKCLPEDARQHFRRLIIPGTRKREIANRLHHMNVNAGSLFPGMDGLGREVRELISHQIDDDVMGAQGFHTRALDEERNRTAPRDILDRILGGEEE